MQQLAGLLNALLPFLFRQYPIAAFAHPGVGFEFLQALLRTATALGAGCKLCIGVVWLLLFWLDGVRWLRLVFRACTSGRPLLGYEGILLFLLLFVALGLGFFNHFHLLLYRSAQYHYRPTRHPQLHL
ncbi:hypothetical protein [Microbulbifer sp.]|uniref:hypothetical protein n=1 Tax=Microbulbifer sp. TaxID=1908541 RepID=UPI00258E4695|nr:hypothetical protein [Microbulbifer sp.]